MEITWIGNLVNHNAIISLGTKNSVYITSASKPKVVTVQLTQEIKPNKASKYLKDEKYFSPRMKSSNSNP